HVPARDRPPEGRADVRPDDARAAQGGVDRVPPVERAGRRAPPAPSPPAPPVRLVYLGTPQIAVPPLEALVAAGHDVALVVTGPDRRRGRGTATSPTPVRLAAERLGVPVTHT